MLQKKIIIFTNADWHFYHHLLPIALEAKNRGFEVKIITNIDKYQSQIEAKGLEVIPIFLDRSGLNIFKEVTTLLKIITIIKRESPDILHNFTVKPVLYGTISSFFCKVPCIVNTYLGMGYLFTGNQFSLRFIRTIMVGVLRIISLFKNITYVSQNSDDQKLLIDLKLARPANIIKQCSVGVDLQNFIKLPEPSGKIIFALVARMLADKGVYEFIEAAKLLHNEQVKAEFWLVGSPDQQNKSSIDKSILWDNHKKGYIRYLGHQDDISKIWEKAHIAVLPSYREGLSRSLLEAAAYGRAIITTNAPGGRELVQDQINGLLVPVGDHVKLAEAMQLLLNNPELRKKLSNNMIKNIVENYDSFYIASKMVNLYNDIR